MEKIQQRFDLNKLNWDHIRRNFPFRQGKIGLKEEYKEGTTKRNMNNLRQFVDLPSFLPVQLKKKPRSQKVGDQIEENKHGQARLESQLTTGVVKAQGDDLLVDMVHESQVDDPKDLADLDFTDASDQAEFLKMVEPIEVGKVVYDKPIVIIYNPNSGKKRNLVDVIENRLKSEKIPYEMLKSERYFMTWELAQQLDMDKYSAIVAVGGDGTMHEVVNGMLSRKDKRTLPVAFIGNGSGNDTTMTLGLHDVDKSLDYIVKGDIIKMDLQQTTLDAEDIDSIPEKERVQRSRYSLINWAYCLSARITHGAADFKGKCACGNVYKRSAMREFCNIKTDVVDIHLDGQLVHENIDIVYMMGLNTKLGGGGFVLDPYAVVNDGLIDLCFMTQKASFFGLVKMMDQSSKHGGIQGYRDDFVHYRAKEIKIVNKTPGKVSKRNPMGEKEIMKLGIDGEDLFFRDFAKSVCLPNKLSVIVDVERMMADSKYFLD